MNGRAQVLALVMMGGAAGAAPVPPPPEGFAGTQYIDGQGCVFARAEAGWVARRDGQGQPICGFPPSLDVRRTDPLTERVVPLSQPAPDPADVLMEQLTRDLRPGEFVADPRPVEERRAPAPALRPDPLADVVRDALAATPALREATGLQGSPELCARLGYRVDPAAARQGSTLGLCPGMQAPATQAVTRPATSRTAAAPAPATRPTSATRPAASSRPAASPPAAASRTAGTTQVTTRRTTVAAAPAPAQTTTEMIPPSARYVQVGAYADDDNAVIVLRALSARGYPTGQTRIPGDSGGVRVIMAGPFPDRKSLITALNALRRDGYPGAVAR